MEPIKIWINKTFQVKQFEPVQFYIEMYLIPTEDGKYLNEEGEVIDSKVDAYLVMLEKIYEVKDRFKVMLKERRKNEKVVEES